MRSKYGENHACPGISIIPINAIRSKRLLYKKNRIGLISFEWGKIFAVRYLWVFLLLFLVLNFLIAYIAAGKFPKAHEPGELIRSFFTSYFSNSEEYDAYYSQLKAFKSEQSQEIQEAMILGNDFEQKSLPNRYSNIANYSDDQLFDHLYSSIDSSLQYPTKIKKIVQQAEANLSEFNLSGIDTNSFAYRYQTEVIRRYCRAQENIVIGIEYISGWDEYFSYKISNILIFMLIIMFCSVIFVQDKQCGIFSILRTTKHGCVTTARVKVIISLIYSCFITLLFLGTTWLAFSLRIGFSSPYNALQALDTFIFSPYQITIGQYFIITILVKLLTNMVFTMLLLTVASVLTHYIPACFCGIIVLAVNVFLYTIEYTNSANLLKNINFISAAAVNPLFLRYRAISIGGILLDYIFLLIIVFIIAVIACALLIPILYSRKKQTLQIASRRFYTNTTLITRIKGGADKIANWGRSIIKQRRTYSTSLIATEMYKMLISSRIIILVVLLLITKIAIYIEIEPTNHSYADEVYKEYMVHLEGPLDEEKLEYLSNERTTIDSVVEQSTTMQKAYIDDQISYGEYQDYLAQYMYAVARSDILEKIERHAAYLMETKTEKDVNAWFIYDTGWKQLFSTNADLWLFAAIIVLCTGCFSMEHKTTTSEGGMSPIVRVTKQGRKHTFYAKVISAGIIVVFAALLFNIVDFIYIMCLYDMPGAMAPISSIQLFSTISNSMSILEYVCIMGLLRVGGALLLAFITLAFSELLQKVVLIIGGIALIFLFPAICSYFNLQFADYFNFMNLFAGTPLILLAASVDLFNTDWGLVWLWSIVPSIGTYLLLLFARQKWCNNSSKKIRIY